MSITLPLNNPIHVQKGPEKAHTCTVEDLSNAKTVQSALAVFSREGEQKECLSLTLALPTTPSRLKEIKPPAYQTEKRWFLMNAYMEKFTKENPGLAPKTVEALEVFALQYIAKVANIAQSNARDNHRAINPYQIPGGGDYHREYLEENRLFYDIESHIKALAGFTDTDVVQISHRAFKQAIRLRYTYINIDHPGNAKNEKEIQEDFRNYLQRVFPSIVSENNPIDPGFFFRLHIPKEKPIEVSGKYLAAKQHVYTSILADEISQFCKIKSLGTAWGVKIQNCIRLGAFTKFKGQEILLLLGIEKDQEMRNLVIKMGFTPMLQRTVKIYRRLADPQARLSIPSSLNPLEELPKLGGQPKDLSEFLNNHIFTRFKMRFLKDCPSENFRFSATALTKLDSPIWAWTRLLPSKMWKGC